jgi:hypothetical protein
MSIRRITISVPESVAGRIKRAARSKPVSAWVTDVIEAHLDDAEMDRQWGAFYEDLGLSPQDERRGDRLFDRLKRAPARATPR